MQALAGRRFGRDLHHVGARAERRRRAGRRLHACTMWPASASSPKRRGHEVRALLADHEGRRLRSRLSGSVGARRGRRARIRRAGGRVTQFDARRRGNGWLLGTVVYGSGCSIALVTLVADQAHKWWMLNVYQHPAPRAASRHPVPRSRVRAQHGHQLRPVRTRRPSGQWLLAGFALRRGTRARGSGWPAARRTGSWPSASA